MHVIIGLEKRTLTNIKYRNTYNSMKKNANNFLSQ